jgi:hypothetical protein
MGTKVTKSGVSIQFCNAFGEIDGPPVFSTYVRFLGMRRDDVLQRSGEPSEEERLHPGSDDWLTLIAIADSCDRLEALVRESGVPVSDSQTSASSRRVHVCMHMGAVRQTFPGRITIASGPIVSTRPPVMNVVHVKVLGEGTEMKPGHPLFEEFEAQAPMRR